MRGAPYDLATLLPASVPLDQPDLLPNPTTLQLRLDSSSSPSALSI
jgi:hypothetical protein